LFCFAFWHWAALRDAVVRADLISPYAMMGIAVALALASAGIEVSKLAVRRDVAADVDERDRAVLAEIPMGLLLAAGMIVFLLPLLHLWAAALSVYSSIGGLLPFSDALNYYAGAQRVLVEGRLDEWNSRRPLNALLLAVRLALVGGDLRGAMLIDAAILGLSCGLMAREVARDCGLPAGFMLFTMLYVVGREHVRVVGSESLGLSLAALASTLLWRAARDGRRSIALCGLTMLTLALNARAGAFFALPALIVWAGWAFRRSGRHYDWGSAAVALGAVVLGFGANAIVLRTYASDVGLGHGNFALSLYGLSTGHPGWTRLYADFPASKAMEERALAHFAYVRAWENIRDRPSDLLRSLSTGMTWWRLAFTAYVREVLSLVPGENRLNDVLQAFIALGVACWLWRSRRDRSTWLILSAFIGLILSAPVVFPDGLFRVLVVSYPLFFLVAAIATRPWRLRPEAPVSSPRLEHGGVWPALFLSVALAVVAFVGPAIAHRFSKARMVEPLSRTDGTQALVIRVGPGTPRLDVLAAGSAEASFVPRIRDEDFARDLSEWPEHLTGVSSSERMRGPMVILLGYDLQRGQAAMNWIVSRCTIPTDEWRTLEITGYPKRNGTLDYFFVSDCVMPPYGQRAAEP
jgi:hypothetical protein